MPPKKWYILMDDDTYLIGPSVRLLLEHLDPNIPQYVGNPVGDFQGRFAHGGSSVILSGPVLYRLFIQNPNIVLNAYRNSLTETWGDKLLATTLLKLGIYLDEQYQALFNGENPFATRIWSDRFCLPLIAFHNLENPEHMRQTKETFKDNDDTVLWGDLWALYHAPDLDSMRDKPVRRDEDHVGKTDEWTRRTMNVENAEECLKVCDKHSSCLAWTWKEEERSCNIAPFMVVGNKYPGAYVRSAPDPSQEAHE
jgi:hypothetical protein